MFITQSQLAFELHKTIKKDLVLMKSKHRKIDNLTLTVLIESSIYSFTYKRKSTIQVKV